MAVHYWTLRVRWTIVIVVLVHSALALPKGTQDPSACDTKHACYPWQAPGPFCARGNLMPIRFFLDIAPEDNAMPWNETVCGINTGPDTPHYALYAYCPVIDTLEAFTLNNSTNVSGTYLENGVRKLTTNGTAFLRVFGMGTTTNIEFPQRDTSEGAAQVIGACPSTASGSASGSSFAPKIAVVPFLIFNISMKQGKFQYYSDYPQPGGVGFNPTCETSNGVDVCLLDPSMECIGVPGRKNCATCYGPDEVDTFAAINIQVWTSFYGTDRTGRNFVSGSNNPLNFRAFAGGTLYSTLQHSLDNVKSGDFNNNPSDIPEGGVTAL